MQLSESPIDTSTRILWTGGGISPADIDKNCVVAVEQTVEAGLLRTQNSPFDCLVVQLRTNSECELLIDFLEQERSTTPVFIILWESGVTEAAMLAHSGAVRVFGPNTSSVTILHEAKLAGQECRRELNSVRQQTWRGALIGGCEAIQRIGDVVGRVASRKSTVLITGESGTGKEVIAKALHAASRRAHKPFLAVNCSALPEQLLESELFGHTRGAFTGAVQNRMGLFERANGGTVLLDEIGDMPVSLQAKLLRVLQEQQFQPLGSSDPVHVDVRIVAATNVDLEKAIVAGRFREDLFYRLNVIPLHLPPLRERIGDIPLLALHFVQKICRAEGLQLKKLTPPAITRLCRYSWPGNIRQLQNVIERAVVTGDDEQLIYPGDLQIPKITNPPRHSETPAVENMETGQGLDFEKTVGDFERRLLDQVLRQTGGNKTRAAELLGLRRTTLSAKLQALESVA